MELRHAGRIPPEGQFGRAPPLELPALAGRLVGAGPAMGREVDVHEPGTDL